MIPNLPGVCAICRRDIDLELRYQDVCDSCGIVIARRYTDNILHEEHVRNMAQMERIDEKRAEKKRREIERRVPIFKQDAQMESVVYYVRIGDHIKIGYSKGLVSRLRQLRVRREDVLAVEPGSRNVEAQRHEQFADLRISPRWEDFTPGPALLEHIEALLREHGRPTWLEKKAPRGKSGPVTVRMRDTA